MLKWKIAHFVSPAKSQAEAGHELYRSHSIAFIHFLKMLIMQNNLHKQSLEASIQIFFFFF